MPLVEQHLSNIDALLASTRAQLIKPSTQTGRILAGEMLIFPVKGRMDDSRSMNASAVALGLLLRGFPDDEISAIVFHLYRKWGVELDKGTEWCKADIARILAYAHTEHPEAKQSPTRYRQRAAGTPIVSTPARSRARADRPRLFDPAIANNTQIARRNAKGGHTRPLRPPVPRARHRPMTWRARSSPAPLIR